MQNTYCLQCICQNFQEKPTKIIWHIQKFERRFQRWKGIKIKFHVLQTKLNDTEINFPEPGLIGKEQTVFADKFTEQVKNEPFKNFTTNWQ